MRKLKELCESFIKSDRFDDKTKRRIQNLLIFLTIGIILIITGGFFSNEEPKEIHNTSTENVELVKEEYFEDYDNHLENKVKNILSKIDGVGNVEVAITFMASKEIVPAQDVAHNESNTKEQDREGGTRNTIELDTNSKVIIGDASDIKPLILKVIPPQISGVIVVCKGAKDPTIKVEVSKAVSTMLGISLSKVEVFPMTD